MANGVIYYGGSFNPPHIGHMRLAIETMSVMRGFASTLYFLPSYHPPHKVNFGILPFNLRVRMLQAACSGIPSLKVSDAETQVSGLSYTFDTLIRLKKFHGKDPLYFLMGSQDFALLPEWKNGLKIINECDILVAPREEWSFDKFAGICAEFWPQALKGDNNPYNLCSGERAQSVIVPGCGAIYLLPIPFLEISSSRIRNLWKCHENLQYLVPGQVLDILRNEHNLVSKSWQIEED